MGGQSVPINPTTSGVILPVSRRRPRVFKATGYGSATVSPPTLYVIKPVIRQPITYPTPGQAKVGRVLYRAQAAPTSVRVRQVISPNVRQGNPWSAGQARVGRVQYTAQTVPPSQLIRRPISPFTRLFAAQPARAIVLLSPRPSTPVIVRPLGKRVLLVCQVRNNYTFAGSARLIKRIQVGGVTPPVSIFVYSVGARGASVPDYTRGAETPVSTRETMGPTGERLH